jgi:hypothetical protein
MKTNKTATICRLKMTKFLHDLAECSDISYQPARILRESTPLLSRIERRRTQSSLPNCRNSRPGFTGFGFFADACYEPLPLPARLESKMSERNHRMAAGNHPPGANAPAPPESGGDSLVRISRGDIDADVEGERFWVAWFGSFMLGKCWWKPRCS